MPSTCCSRQYASTGCRPPPDGLVFLRKVVSGAPSMRPCAANTRCISRANTGSGSGRSASKLRQVTRASSTSSKALPGARGRSMPAASSPSAYVSGGGGPSTWRISGTVSVPRSFIACTASLSSQRVKACSVAPSGCQCSARRCSSRSRQCAWARPLPISRPVFSRRRHTGRVASGRSRVSVHACAPTWPSRAQASASISTSSPMCGASAIQRRCADRPSPPESRWVRSKASVSRGSM